MTAFATSTLPQAEQLAFPSLVRPDPRAVRWAVDAMVDENRAQTPPEAVNRRKISRYSIGELNDLPEDRIADLARKIQENRYDRRPVAVKALDLIDLPRNMIANIAFGRPSLGGVAGGIGTTALAGAGFGAAFGGPIGAGIGALTGGGIAAGGAALAGLAGALVGEDTRRAVTADKERATFDMPRVQFSDALKAMGVENRVVRGLVGFLGDVALDPLTYLGGTGAGMRLVTSTGRGAEVTISRTGRSLLNKAVKNIGKTGSLSSIGDDATRELIRGLGLDDAALKKLSLEASQEGATLEGKVRSAVFGTIERPRVAGVLRPLGFDSRASASPLADAAFTGNQAAGNWIRQYQRGSTALPGLATAGARAGEVGSEILHIPFTDAAVRVKPFTTAARERAAIATIMRAGKAAPLETSVFQRSAQAANLAQDGLNNITSILEDANRAKAQAAVSPITFDEFGNVQFADPTLDIERLRTIRDEVQQVTGGLVRDVQAMSETIPVGGLTPEVMLANARVADQYANEYRLANAAYEAARADVKQVAAARTARAESIRAEAALALKDGPMTPETAQRLSDLYQAYDTELSAVQQAWMGLDDVEFQAMSAYLDVLAGRVQAVRAASEAAMNPVRAGLTSQERVIVDVAKRILGTPSDNQGSMILGPLSEALQNRLGQESKVAGWIREMGRVQRGLFGDRAGAIYHEARRLHATRGMGARQFIEIESGRMRDQLRAATADVLTSKQFNQNWEQIDNLTHDLATAKVAEANPQSGYHLFEFDPNDADGILRDTVGNPVPAAWMASIQKATQDGLLSEKQYPGLRAILERHADELIANYQQLAEAGGDDLGLVAREAYLPNMPTDAFLERARASRAASGDRSRLVGKQNAAITEAFQKRRSSDQYRFVGADGKWKRWFEWQRAYAVNEDLYSDAALRTRFGEGSPEFNRIKEIQQTIAEWQALPEADKIKYGPRPTHPSELNKMVADGHFEMLTNRADIKGSAFETGATQIWAKRLSQQQRANARTGMVDLLSNFGMLVDKQIWEANRGRVGEFIVPPKGGTTGPLFGGIKGRMLPEGVLQIGTERFRPIDINRVTGDGEILFKGLFNPDIMDTQIGLFPERIAEQIERMFEAFKSPNSLDEFLRATDKITGAWKGFTLFHPSWTAGNIISSSLLSVLAGVTPPELVANFKDAARIVFARGGVGLDRLVDIGNGPQPVIDIAREAFEHGVIGASSRTSEAVPRMVANDGIRLIDPRAFSLSGIADRWRDAERIAAESNILSKLPAGKKFGTVPIFITGQSKAVMGAWVKANAQVEDTIRLATYIALRKKGLSGNDAARRVITNLFDYQDLTGFERNVAKRALPFYVWLKNSLVHQVGYALEHPWYAGLAPKVKEALEEATLGDAQVPDHHRPAWLREQLAIQIGANPDSRWAFTIGSLLPQEQLIRTLAGFMGPEGAMDYANFFAASLNPQIRVPLELGFGREAFTDRKIGPTAEQGDLSAIEYLAGQIRPLRELGSPFSIRRGAVPAAFSRSTTEGLARIGLGGRGQPMNDDRMAFNNKREFQDAEEGMRKAINIAIREGNESAAQNAKMDLLRLYDAALSLGFDDIVPKWAQTKLAEIKGVSDS